MNPSAAGTGSKRGRPKVAAALRDAAAELSGQLGAEGCVISRLIGQLLIDIAWHSSTDRQLWSGRNYLLTDFPLTAEVVERGEPRTVRAADPMADPNEVELLAELGFDSLLILALEAEGECWGLVELYRAGDRPFTDQEIAQAKELVADLGRRLGGIEQKAPGARPETT